jgi:hypothetical protein
MEITYLRKRLSSAEKEKENHDKHASVDRTCLFE